MTPNEFWAVIAHARQHATLNSEPAMLDALYRELVKLPNQELYAWYGLQNSYMDLADTPKLFTAAVLINGGSSDDRFTDFTAWLVAQGKTVYESALANPDSLAQIDLPFDNAEWNSAVTLPGMRMRANNTWTSSAPRSLRGGRFAAVTRNVRIWRHRWNESVWIPPCIGRSARQQPPLIWMTTSCKLKSCKGYGRPVPSEISGAPCRKAEKGRRCAGGWRQI